LKAAPGGRALRTDRGDRELRRGTGAGGDPERVGPEEAEAVQPPLPADVTSAIRRGDGGDGDVLPSFTVMLLRATPAALTPLPEKVTP